jgi:hypothetical protein
MDSAWHSKFADEMCLDYGGSYYLIVASVAGLIRQKMKSIGYWTEKDEDDAKKMLS